LKFTRENARVVRHDLDDPITASMNIIVDLSSSPAEGFALTQGPPYSDWFMPQDASEFSARSAASKDASGPKVLKRFQACFCSIFSYKNILICHFMLQACHQCRKRKLVR
jgi:hypothetical protein